MEFLNRYQLLVSTVTAWALAQISKTIIHYIVTGTFERERLLGTGGMPSSHASTVCALATASLIKYGSDTFEFAVTLILAIIVIVDAMGVRLETGKQAKLLNDLLDKHWFKLLLSEPEQHFKELVGHTPFQVFIGALLGITISILFAILIH